MYSSNIFGDDIAGQEALTVGERLTSYFKELSLGIDAFNAKHFNKSIHKLTGQNIWKELAEKNIYFSVSTKHIPSPVFFNSDKLSFKSYVEFILKAVPIIKLVDTQAEQVYRGIKSAAATGRVPYTLAKADTSIRINETRAEFNNFVQDTRVYTRAVNQMYANFNQAYDLAQDFNSVVETLSSRDVEVVAKRADQVINIVNLLKAKVDASDVILSPDDSELLNKAISNLVDNIRFAGVMIAQLSDLTSVMQLQINEARKLAN